MKKTLLLLLVVSMTVALSGCSKKSEEAKSQNDNSADEIQGKLDEQQSKIDELQAFKDEQVKLEGEKKSQEESAKAQAELRRVADEQESNKARIVAQCEDKKAECDNQINQKKDLISNGEKYIKSRDTDIKNINDNLQTEKARIEGNGGTMSDGYIKQYTDPMAKHEELKKEKEDEMKKLKKELAGLLSGECKDYKKSCE